MMMRDNRPLFITLLGAGFLFLLVVVAGPFVRTHPTELLPGGGDPAGSRGGPAPIDNPPPNKPDLPPWMKVATLAGRLHESEPGLVVDRAGDRARACRVFDRADPTELPDDPPTEDFADSWRGQVLCMADHPPGLPEGPHSCRAGDFWLFGDAQLLARVRPAAESIHFGPYRGEGGPPTPAGLALGDAPDPATADAEVAEVHELATLTPAQAARLDGKRGLFRVVIDGPGDRQGGRDVYEVLPPDNPQGIVFLAGGPDADGELTVEGTLRVIHHAANVYGGQTFPRFTEYRLVGRIKAALAD